MPETDAPVLRFDRGVTLVGGGVWTRDDLTAARGLAPTVIAADGGADLLDDIGAAPEAIIGDLDSLRHRDAWAGRTRVVHVREQDSTDLEKCLRAVDAPFFVGVGFTGGRLDHTLAALHAMLAWPAKRLILIGAEDVIIAPPLDWRIELPPGTRLSIWPMAPVCPVACAGLRWPVTGLAMAAGRQIGTSNETAARDVRVTFNHAGALILLPRAHLSVALGSIKAPPPA